MNTYKYKIVNGKIEDFNSSDEKVSFNEYGLPIYIEDYGMGSVYWPLIKDKDDQIIRQRLEDTIWAVERLKWATKNAQDKRPELIAIILRGSRH